MFERLVPPLFELMIFRELEKELAQRLELRRVSQSETIREPSVADEVLLLAGNALIGVGQWIRARSVTAEFPAYAEER
jgi:hypothetical protein